MWKQLVVGVSFVVTAACSQGNPKEVEVKLRNAAGDEVGMATMSEQPGGVKIQVKAKGFDPGPHGFHVHGVGECKAPNFASAGNHFNPDEKEHGLLNARGAENGDLPNLMANEQGEIKAEVMAPNISFKEGKKTMYRKSGTALIITENADDGMTQPTGNSGKRLACGVITKKVKGYKE
ncbi:superoxide dismutase family protein [Ectobacillus antri]|jgi:Cu-Zn family superoxide dismutase|uniref:Superoxide dismutase [Cu-Zn] n=1 Tax=Ectobacillus antri TaxID=2486280 RepID=A0ABT6H9E6_9BACI|nr:superoxide dismutase family protein [Ectobacillus antri]MDG4658275.1 superoxide dismutase family protein [Ectobacillus antri]MDG5755344.1 superoxide dismutase family protein [Ectobacillus antri]